MSNMISVSQFNNYVHNIFVAEEILQNISVYGEVSGLSYSGGNLYFSIKDEGAVLNCVKFGYANGYVPKEGEMIIAVGSPNYYVKGGRFSFNVVRMQPYGQGVLYKQFLELKDKLEKQGLFDVSKKKVLPEKIARIGVVTSETGAVIQDIIDVTGRRNPMLDIVLFPAKVQGIGAEQTIIQGLSVLSKTDVDVIIIARGGGSAEDLSTFNSEKLAYAIFECDKFVISAVGHETDFTIADFVADLRAPTPSAAAELVSKDIKKLEAELVNNITRLLRVTEGVYEDSQDNLYENIVRMNYALNNYFNQTEYALKEQIIKIDKASAICEQEVGHKIELLAKRLEMVNPIKILRMGYSQASSNGEIVNSIKQVKKGDEIDLVVCDGVLKCIVEDKGEKL